MGVLKFIFYFVKNRKKPILNFGPPNTGGGWRFWGGGPPQKNPTGILKTHHRFVLLFCSLGSGGGPKFGDPDIKKKKKIFIFFLFIFLATKPPYGGKNPKKKGENLDLGRKVLREKIKTFIGEGGQKKKFLN